MNIPGFCISSFTSKKPAEAGSVIFCYEV